jgi:hypothetical protein
MKTRLALSLLLLLLSPAAFPQQGPSPIGSAPISGSAPIVVTGNVVSCPTCGTGTGTVSSVSFTGGLVSVATPTSTPAFTVAGNSGGIPYFSSGSTWASSNVLGANQIVLGGGAGAAPATDSTASTDGSGHYTFSASAAASTPSFTFSGAPFTGGTGTTTVPELYINKSSNSAPSTWSTSGTLFGENAPSGFSGSFLDFHVNGGGSIWSLSATGTVNAAGQYVLTESNGSIQAKLYQTITNCSAAGTAASPSVASCSAAPAGAFSCATNASGATCTVNTTAVTTNSDITITPTSSAGGRLGVTCNTTADTPTGPRIASISNGTSFTINLGTFSTNPECFFFTVTN